MNWITTQINRLRNWWNNNHATVRQEVADGTRRDFRRIDRIAGNIGR